uniref:RNase P subunit p30 n=1 Tax=Arion vulgaris TaxID=1028688 RepID=A0A0B6ZST8_9EUPU
MAPPLYTDLNVPLQSVIKLSDILELGLELGFEQFAINYTAPSLQGGKGKKNEKLVVPPPTEILLNDESVREMQKRYPSFKQLSRFTAVLEDASNTHRLGATDIQAYDIIAVQATSEKTFQLACSTLDVDIISLNFSENLGFSLKRPMVKMAAKRGIHFEIVFSPALLDNSVKRNIISNALSLVRTGGGKNIILSSGSKQPLDLRSPYDVVNLAKLLVLVIPKQKMLSVEIVEQLLNMQRQEKPASL